MVSFCDVGNGGHIAARYSYLIYHDVLSVWPKHNAFDGMFLGSWDNDYSSCLTVSQIDLFCQHWQHWTSVTEIAVQNLQGSRCKDYKVCILLYTTAYTYIILVLAVFCLEKIFYALHDSKDHPWVSYKMWIPGFPASIPPPLKPSTTRFPEKVNSAKVAPSSVHSPQKCLKLSMLSSS